MKAEDLTDPEYWESTTNRAAKLLPNPRRSRADFQLLSRLNRLLRPNSSARLIEMGCGGSYWLPYFAKFHGLDVAGIDYSEVLCKRSRESLQQLGLRGEIRCQDFRDVPPEWEGKFDYVFSLGVVEHFRNPSQILTAFSRYLRPRGLMITAAPYLGGLWGSVQRKIDSDILDAHLIFDLQGFIGFHKQAGLEVIQANYLRWGDPTVLNTSKMAILNQKIIAAGSFTINLLLRFLEALHALPTGNARFSAEMLVIARARS